MVLGFKVIVALGKREGHAAEGFKVMVTQGKREGNGSRTRKKGGVTKTMMATELRKKGGNGNTRKEKGAMAKQKKRRVMAQLGTSGIRTTNEERRTKSNNQEHQK
jgi:hypothetical protein